jgi:hypothetical protein
MTPPHGDRGYAKKNRPKGGFYAKQTEKTWQAGLTAFVAFILGSTIAEVAP